jgi:hypothetical protein
MWLKRLADEDKAHAVWRERAGAAQDQYCKYDAQSAKPLFPVFNTTVKLIHGRIYGSPPKPDVRKRNPSGPQAAQMGTGTPPPLGGMAAPNGASAPPQGMAGGIGPSVPPSGQPGGIASGPQLAGGGAGLGAMGQGQPQPMGGLQLGPMGGPLSAQPIADAATDDNTIAMCIERAIAYTIDTTLFDRDAHLAVNDFLVAGNGVAKVEMDTYVDKIPVLNPITNEPVLDAEGQPLEQAVITEQCLNLRHFSWKQFRWHPCKDWRSCNWVAFEHYMTKDDIEEQFKIELAENTGQSSGTNTGDSLSRKPPQMSKYEDSYTVYEVWDKTKKKRYWISECHPKELDSEDDPLELKDFFPCPAPMMANVSGEELLPNPDYWDYQELVKQATELADRIYQITKQVKDVAFYDSAFGELKMAVQDYPDGSFIAINQLMERLRSQTGKATGDAIIYHLEMEEKVMVLQQLIQQMEWVKSRIYEVNGIADIQRGVSNPNDTATAQKIKNDWADIRTGQRVQVVALFFRDVFRIMAQLIAQKFQPEQIEAMSGIALTDLQLATMRSDLATSYAVDVESDSTMVQDDSTTQEQVMQFTQAWTGYCTALLPLVKHDIMPADLFKEGLMLIKDAYKSGRQLEQTINALPSTLVQLQGLQSQIGQMQQQGQQLQQQNQELQQQLQQANMGKQAIEGQKVQNETVKTGADAQNKQANTEKQQAEAHILGAEAAKKEAEAHQTQRANIIEGLATGIQ